MKRRTTVVLAVLALALVAAFSTTAEGLGATGSASAEPAAQPVNDRYAQKYRDVREKMAQRITPEQRAAAAANQARLRAAVSRLRAAASREGDLSVSAVPVPGGIPDYFGSPNWAFSPQLRKFVDSLPGLGAANANNLGQYLPVAVPDTITYPGSDYYEISVRQYQEKMHSDLPPTTLRGYVQTNKGTDANGANTVAPAPIHYMGPIIIARKDRPVRIKFTNELPTGMNGDLFVPTDVTVMGAGMGPLGMDVTPGYPMNFTQNRATLHLHGGKNPWISDGTPHQWITPAGENTDYPRGVSAVNVPDMPDPGPNSWTLMWSNQQSARLMFYHDHAWGITRLNVYVGEAAGYMITDQTEQDLITSGLIPSEQIPLIIQDKSFVDAATVRDTDPTWNWGTGAPDAGGVRPPVTGDLWYPHVYSPAQNPYDITGANPFGRWHYGPWFWPPTRDITYPPVPNPYYDPVAAPWEPPEMPATPNPSMPGESFMDTAIVNGTAFPYLKVKPKAYRFRILNAANDRFFNLQMYVADPAVVSSDGRANTEVAMVPAVPTPGFPDTWPTDGREGGVPDPATAGPDWIQIANDGGFLPMPAVIPAQPIAYNMNPTTFNFGNVSDHSLLLGPAERADVVVDFSAYAGKTLIVYNDAPTAFPALDPRYDYYTGAPDLSAEGGHAGPRAGFGPNTRTIMQIRVEAAGSRGATRAAPAFDLAALKAAFTSGGPGSPSVFQKGQNPIIVGQTAYNATYNTTFPAIWPNWGVSRIQDNSLSFQTVAGATVTLPMEPKAIQDEMGEAYDKEYGRMSGKLGLELPNTSATTQNFVLQAFVDPATEIIDDTDVSAVQIGEAGDGTQIWKITHNGVDTHPIHFHLFDVQLINRVGWDGAIRLPDANELGWKDTVRISPLEDTIVALRAVSPKLPYGVPDSVRPLNPAEPIGSPMGFTNIDPTTGQPIIPPILNELVNFGWEYVWHCHILSHEEMDMMRPIQFRVATSLPPAPVLSIPGSGPPFALTWTDPTPVADPATKGNPANEVGFRIERAPVVGDIPGTYVTIGAALANATSYTDTSAVAGTSYFYRVVAYNASGSTNSNTVRVDAVASPPAAPTNLVGTLASQTGVDLAWTDNATDETGFVVERSGNGGPFVQIAALGARSGTGSVAFSDSSVVPGTTYDYRVKAVNSAGSSAYSNTVNIVVPAAPTPPAPPSNLSATAALLNRSRDTVTVTWTDNSSDETSFTLQRATDSTFTAGLSTTTIPANITTTVETVRRRVTYWYRVRASNAGGNSGWSNVVSVLAP